MPWCDECDHFVAENDVTADRCPDCGEPVNNADLSMPQLERAPWHFWLVVAAVVAYLGWRLIEGVIWVAGRF